MSDRTYDDNEKSLVQKSEIPDKKDLEENCGSCKRNCPQEKRIITTEILTEQNIEVMADIREDVSDLKETVIGLKATVEQVDNSLADFSNGGLEEQLMKQSNTLIKAMVNETELDKKIKLERWKLVLGVVTGSGILTLMQYFISSLLE